MKIDPQRLRHFGLSVLWMVALWAIFWQDASWGNLLLGAAFAGLIVLLFPLPPLHRTGRFHLLYALGFLGVFLWKILGASLQVGLLSLTHGSRVDSSVLVISVRKSSDLIITLTAHVFSLIPGSLVLEIDHERGALLVHVVDRGDGRARQKAPEEVRTIQTWLMRILGSSEHAAPLTEGQPAGASSRRPE